MDNSFNSRPISINLYLRAKEYRTNRGPKGGDALQLGVKASMAYTVIPKNRTPVIFSNNFNKYQSITIFLVQRIYKEYVTDEF